MKKIMLLLMALFALVAGKAQTITGVTPGEAEKGQKLSVVISGQNTNFTQGTSSVWFTQGTSSVFYPQSFTPISDTEIEAELIIDQNQPIGNYDVNVGHYDTSGIGYYTLPGGFKVLADQTPPVLTSIPGSAVQGTAFTFTISGQNTHFVQATNTIYLKDGDKQYYLYTENTANSDESLYGTSFMPYSFKAGEYSMCVSNAIDGTVCKGGFIIDQGINPPVLVSVTPSKVSKGQIVNLEIKGQNTHFLDYDQMEYPFYSSFWLSSEQSEDIYLQIIDEIPLDDQNMILQVEISNSIPAGVYDFNSYHYVDGILNLTEGIEIGEPEVGMITSVTPTQIKQGQVLPVFISGQNTSFTQGTNVVWFNQGTATINVSNLTVLTDDFMTGTVSVPLNIPAGEYQVNVYNTNLGTIPSGVSIQILARNPVLTSVTPSEARQGQTLNVYISGNDTYFMQGTNTSISIFNDEVVYYAENVTTITNGLVMAKFSLPSNANTGLYSIGVTDPLTSNMLYLNDSFTIKPVISATGVIRGTLIDNDDIPVPNYELRILSLEGGLIINEYYVHTDENGKFELNGLYPGLYSITGGFRVVPASVTLEEGQEKEVTLVYLGNIVIEGTTEAGNDQFVNIYPMPMEDECVIEYIMNEPGEVKIEVLNSQGDYLGTLKEGYSASGLQRATLTSDRFTSSGFYLIRIVTGETVVTKKVVKQGIR